MHTTAHAIPPRPEAEAILRAAHEWRERLDRDLHEPLVEAIYEQASRIVDRTVSRPGKAARPTLDRTIDRLVTSRRWGIPIMVLLFAGMLWLTITGANVPSAMLASLLLDVVHPWLRGTAAALGVPAWVSGLTIDGMYLATAWVVSVMLPPMAIFFPLFTLLEDFGYLPRVAFNLDRLFKTAGAHGKQAMTTMMGFGCNAAGVVSTRIIDSPRERLLAIITNNFAICNGRWPTQFLIATIFIGTLAPAHRGARGGGCRRHVGRAAGASSLALVVGGVLSRTIAARRVALRSASSCRPTARRACCRRSTRRSSIARCSSSGGP